MSNANKKMSVVILAAGKGTRMFSDKPKVLHELAGKPLLQHVIEAVRALKAHMIHVVCGFGADQLKARFKNVEINWVFQQQQAGTGHALQQAAPFFDDDEDILMLFGDGPLIQPETLQRLQASKPESGMALLSVNHDDPTGYGRVLREQGDVVGIVEHKDATEEQLKIREINTGIFIANGADLKRWLNQIDNDNAQGEYYVTDVIGMAHREGRRIVAIHPDNPSETEGVNTCLQLSELERVYQKTQAKKLLEAGVMLRDLKRFDLRGCLEHGRDVEIDINVIVEGDVVLGNRVKIGAGCIIKNTVIGDDCHIAPYCVIENAQIEAGCCVGPFARLRAGTRLKKSVHVGNFVEI